jgi:hypothetical protein
MDTAIGIAIQGKTIGIRKSLIPGRGFNSSIARNNANTSLGA